MSFAPYRISETLGISLLNRQTHLAISLPTAETGTSLSVIGRLFATGFEHISVMNLVNARFILFFLLFIGLGEAFAQIEEETIPWSAERKLEWSDFKGSYLKTQWAAATTATSISYSLSVTEKDQRRVLDIEVGCEFYPQKSWYRPEVCDSLVLSHEQLHFDIAELHARKFRKKLAETHFTKDIKEEIRAIYKGILKQLYIFQNRYDHDTNFSRDWQKQLLWNQRIAKELAVKP